MPERQPELFDEEGCLKLTDDEVDCTSRAADIDAALEEDATAPRELRGFNGAGWATQLSGELVLVEDSLSITSDGVWAARGLVRNEQAEQVGSIVVRAALVGANDEVVAELEAPAAVGPVRPGEPVPFALVGDGVAADEVVGVRWSLEAGEPDDAVRDLEIAEFWHRGFADRRSAESYLYADEGELQSHVRFGSVTNLAQRPTEDLLVVAAWLDDDGRVLAVARGPVVPVRPEDNLDEDPQLLEDGDGDLPPEAPLGPPATVQSDVEPPRERVTADDWDSAVLDGPRAVADRPALQPGASADFVIVVEAGTAPGAIDQAVVYLWAVGR